VQSARRCSSGTAIVAAFNVEGQEAFYNEPGGKSVIVEPPDGKLPYSRPR
jgi:hypothetical protein